MSSQPKGRRVHAARPRASLQPGTNPAPSAEAVMLAHAQVLHAGQPTSRATMRLRRPDGTELSTDTRAQAIVAEDRSPLGVALTLHHPTGQGEVELRKDHLVAEVSHELRTPLATIKAAIGVVLSNEPADIPESLHRMLLHINGAADVMTGLVNDLFELSCPQAARTPLALACHDLRAMALRAANVVEVLAQTRGQRVRVQVPADAVPLLVDAERLERALLNLLMNAHKYGCDGGTIDLRLENRPNEILLTVADDGPGIPLADQDRIFERFIRLEHNGHRTEGNGMGLAIALANVELHGGRMGVESAQGSGSTFWITLPKDRPSPAPRGSLRDEASGGR